MPPAVAHSSDRTAPPAAGDGAKPRLITAEEFEAMPEASGPCELVHGELRPLMSNNPIHSSINSNLAFLIGVYARQAKVPVHVLCGEVGVFTSLGSPATSRAADLAVISKERLPELPASGFLRVMPELLVEIISGSNTWTDTFEKIYEYFEGGAKLVWIVDPAMKEVRVFRSAKENELLRASSGDALNGENVLPGFSAPVADVFAV